MADVADSVGSDNGLWAEDDEQEIPTKDEVLRILLDLQGTKRSSLKKEHVSNLKELFRVIQKFRQAGPTEDEDEHHHQLWSEFELTYGLDTQPFTSISTFELPPSPGPASPDKLAVPSISEPSIPSSSATTPAQSVNAVASSSTTNGIGRTISPLPARSAPATVPPPVRVPLLPVPNNINPSTYCLPLSLISAPPPAPPSTTDFTAESGQLYDPPLEAETPRIPLPLVSSYARALYPLPTLPADAAKKAASKARSKKGSSSASAMGGSNGATSQPQPPADLYKWSATVNANPLSVMVRSAKKCLGSADWETAYNELRFNRAMQRVEQLKNEGRWSFRQPKKQKGPPLAKSHWDWMLEEMKWMQTDFKEERRWKVALAYEMSQWVLDWHDAEDKSDVCVRVGTRKFTALPVETDADGDARMEGEGEEADFGSGVSEERADLGEEAEGKDAATDEAVRSKLDGLDAKSARLIDTSTTANDTLVGEETAVDNLSATVEAQAAVEDALELMEDKMTDTARDESDDPLHLDGSATKPGLPVTGEEDADADGEDAEGDDVDGEVEMLDIPELDKPAPSTINPSPAIKDEVVLGNIVPPELPAEDAKPLADEKTAENDPLDLPVSGAGALKSGSANPTLAASDVPPEASEIDVEARVRTARETLLQLSSTSLIFDIASFSSTSTAPPGTLAESEKLTDENGVSTTLDPTSSLDSHIFADLFGDLSTYSMPLPLSEHSIQNGRIDRRIDDATTAGGKLAHTSRLLDIKPVLVSTLQPGKRRKDDDWDDLGDLWGGSDQAEYGEPRGEIFTGGTTLFARKKVRESVNQPSCSKPNQPRNFEIRLAATIWQNDDDIVLQRLCHQFPFNWQLISDAFNTSRRTLSIDRRSPWDCFQRWNKKWNPNPEKEADKRDGPTSEPGMIDEKGGESGPSSPGGSTKKGAASKMQPAILDPKFEGSKKKLRHAKLYEAMRKTAKRRDVTNRKPNLKGEPRRVLTAHESHNQYITSRVGGPTPADLSQHKYERDKAFQEAARAAHEQRELAYKRYKAQSEAVAAQQNGGQLRPNGTGTPPAGGPPFPNGNRPPGNYPNGGGPPMPQLTQQQQQQMQAQRLAALAAAQAGGGPVPNGGPPGSAQQLQQLQLLQAHRAANQGRQPTPAQQQAMRQAQAQQQAGGDQRKSSPNMMGSPSTQAGQISRPGSSASASAQAVGQLISNARGDTPQEIAQSLVATVPAEIAARIDKPLLINGHQVTPALIQQAVSNKLRAEAAAAHKAAATAAAGSS